MFIWVFVCLFVLKKKKPLAEDVFEGMIFVAGMSGFCFLCSQGILMAAVLKVFSDALFPFIILFSLYFLKSSVINLFKPSGEGGRKQTPVTRNERGLIFVDTNVSVVHRTECRVASSCGTQKSAFSKAQLPFAQLERSKDCNQTALSNVTLVMHLLFPLLHL